MTHRQYLAWREWLRMHYNPKLEVRTGELTEEEIQRMSLESKMRWMPTYGLPVDTTQR